MLGQQADLHGRAGIRSGGGVAHLLELPLRFIPAALAGQPGDVALQGFGAGYSQLLLQHRFARRWRVAQGCLRLVGKSRVLLVEGRLRERELTSGGQPGWRSRKPRRPAARGPPGRRRAAVGAFGPAPFPSSAPRESARAGVFPAGPFPGPFRGWRWRPDSEPAPSSTRRPTDSSRFCKSRALLSGVFLPITT